MFFGAGVAAHTSWASSEPCRQQAWRGSEQIGQAARRTGRRSVAESKAERHWQRASRPGSESVGKAASKLANQAASALLVGRQCDSQAGSQWATGGHLPRCGVASQSASQLARQWGSDPASKPADQPCR